jgi:phosphoribosylamine--glycine ligase
MKVLVIGSGGREHALAWKIARSPLVTQVWSAPGSAGMSGDATPLPHATDITNAAAMAGLAAHLGADLTVVGPEAPLVAGVADELAARGLKVAGASRAAARLEGSKIFAKEFMHRHKIPTAPFLVAADLSAARAALERTGYPVVIKADGLAAGKGVVIARDRGEALTAAEAMMAGSFGDAGRRVVIEEFIPGEEMTFMAVADGERYAALAPIQDHKAAFDGDQGPNTGGMGAYCDDGIMSRLGERPGGEPLRRRILHEIVEPTLAGMIADGTPYRGVLYFGLMIADGAPHLLEYNARFGDPETQALVTRMESDIVPLLLGDFDRPVTWLSGASVCVVLASRGYPGGFMRGFPIYGLPEAAALPNVKVFHAGTAQEGGRFVTHGGRVLGVTATGADLQDAIARAYGAVEKIRFDGMHYRRDIGAKGAQPPCLSDGPNTPNGKERNHTAGRDIKSPSFRGSLRE